MVMMRHMFDTTTTTQQMIDHHLRTGCESSLGRVNVGLKFIFGQLNN